MVLRVAVIHRGRITTERLFKPGSRVRIGTDPTNELRVPENPVTGASYLLFEPDGGALRLHVTRGFGHGSRLALEGQITQLAALRADEGVVLEPRHRGKLLLGELTVLFQFVKPPPAASLAPLPPMDFRPSLLDADDPALLASTAVWSALALLLSVWVWNAEAPVYELDDRLFQLPDSPAVVYTLPAVAPAPELVAVTRIVQPVPKVADPTDVGPVEPTPRSPGTSESAEESVEKRPMIATLMGTTGNGRGMIENAWERANQGAADIQELLDSGRTGMELDGEPGGSRACVDCERGAARIGDLVHVGGTGGTGLDGLGGGPEAGPRVWIDPKAGVVSESIADGARVKQFVQRKQPALKFCYDHVLKTDAKVEGRVEVAWTVEAGRVADVYVVGNSSGSKALERCLVERISSWRFPEGIEGDITWPFMFRL